MSKVFAYLNALQEEGRKEDCIHMIHKVRKKKGLPVLQNVNSEWSKQQLLDYLFVLETGCHPF